MSEKKANPKMEPPNEVTISWNQITEERANVDNEPNN